MAFGIALYVLLGWPSDGAGFLGFQVLTTLGLGTLARGKDGLKSAGPKGVADLHGSAAWATVAQMRKAGRLLRRGDERPEAFGFGLGRVAEAGRGDDPRLRYMGHVVTCAPTGAGKGVGAVIPTLLEYPGSVFCLDVKGENYAVTAARRRAMGQRVIAIDPFGVTKTLGGDHRVMGCNWLDGIDPHDPEGVSEAAVLADLLVFTEGACADPYWDEAAKDFLRGLILYVASLPRPRRSMAEVRRFLVEGEAALDEAFTGMLAMGPASVPARAAQSLMAKADKERSGVLSMAVRHTAILDDPRVAECLARSDFSFRELKEGGLSIYLIVPPAKLNAYSRLLRGFVGLAIGAMTASASQSPWKVAFLLDEFAALGRMQVVEDAIAILRGYGVALWLFVQDLSQLQKVYPKADSLLANAAKQFWNTADLETSKYVSGMLGQMTVSYESRSEGVQKGLGGLLGGSQGGSKSTQYVGRPLLMPEEILKLGAKPIVLIQGEPPYLLERLNYRKDPEYEGLAGPNPYHEASRTCAAMAREQGGAAKRALSGRGEGRSR